MHQSYGRTLLTVAQATKERGVSLKLRTLEISGES
jgi:hypothetical protein